MKRAMGFFILLLLAAVSARTAFGFCGFYVAKADTKLFNKASRVVLVRDGDRTVLTMANDYEGELSEFAIVVPVPVLLKEGQVHVGDRALIERFDAFSAPRLVEYHDSDPCSRLDFEMADDRAARLGARGGDTASHRPPSWSTPLSR